MTYTKKASTWHWKQLYNQQLLHRVQHRQVHKITRHTPPLEGNKGANGILSVETHADDSPHLLERLERTTQVLEKYFGIPLGKGADRVTETPHLGMEHQTNIAYGNQFRYAKVGGEILTGCSTTSLAMNGGTNKMTNKDWAHMWVQKAFVVLAMRCTYVSWKGKKLTSSACSNTARSTQNIKPMVRGEAVDSDDAYHGIFMAKGLLHAYLRYVLGTRCFFLP